MTEPGGDGWAPFPVQDWRRLPVDPLRGVATAPVRGTAYVVEPDVVDPRWAPPSRHRLRGRPAWLPLVVLVAVGALLAGSAAVAVRRVEPVNAALRYVPADGSASYQRVEQTRELQTTGSLVVTESARLEGPAALLSGDAALTERVLVQDFADPATTRLWRTVSTPVDDAGSPVQTIRFYRVRGDVELAGESGPGAAYVFSPALVELPADVAPGSRWTSAGSAGGGLDYRSSFSAAAGSDGCLDVTGELAYTSMTGQPASRLALTRTWCPGRGQVASSSSVADLRTVVTPVAEPTPGPVTTADAGIAWDDPAEWKPSTLTTVSADPVLGQRPMVGAVLSDRPGVRTDSGLVVRPMTAPADLVATTPKTPTSWVSVWRAHPGGTVTTLSAFGDVLLATTSERQLVAYDDKGVRRWRRPLDELAPSPPVRVDDTDAVIVDLGGTATRFDLATGRTVWRHPLGSDVNLAPVVGAGLVVVADRGGTVTALDAGTGEVRWTSDLAARGLLVVPGPSGTADQASVLAVQDQVVHALAADTGRHRWIRHYAGVFTDLALLGDRPVVASKEETVVLDGAGRVVRRLPGYLELTPTLQHVAGWTTDRLDVLGRDATVVATWPAPPTSPALSARPAVASPDGLLLFGDVSGWTFTCWARHP